jgi:uncharacterized protein (DUF305 family)
METKPLLFGLIGFMLGGLLVSVAATSGNNNGADPQSDTSMAAMTESLRGKTGDEYDKAFIAHMIAHHESAVDMAELSADRAKHQEVKDLSNDIISAQQAEITEMRQWQKDWGYGANGASGTHSIH